jgi:hypothetical protein
MHDSSVGAMERFLEQLSRFKMGFSPSGNKDDVAGPGIACGRFRTGVLDLENSETANFDAIAFDKTFPHGGEDAIHHFRGECFFAARLLGNFQSQVFLCGCHIFLLYILCKRAAHATKKKRTGREYPG